MGIIAYNTLMFWATNLNRTPSNFRILSRFLVSYGIIPNSFPIFIKQNHERGVAIFAKACFGHPSQNKRQKLNATVNAFGAPIRPRHLAPTQQGVGTQAPNDLTPCRMPFYQSLTKVKTTAFRRSDLSMTYNSGFRRQFRRYYGIQIWKPYGI